MAFSVLIVEDDPDIREVLSVMIGYAGFTVLEAGSGSEALALMSSSPEVLMCFSCRATWARNGRWPSIELVA